MTAATQPVPPTDVHAAPSPELLLRLQVPGVYPCVSVLLTTRPGPVLDRGDVAALRALLAEAQTRLRTEALDPQEFSALMARLHRMADHAAAQPSGRALALFADARTEAAVRLPVPVRDRVVIDPTFATRDLVRSLLRTPRHVVLTLSHDRAQLFDGHGGALKPLTGNGFPIELAGRPRPDGRRPRRATRGRGRADLPTEREVRPDPRLLRRVDVALGRQLQVVPAPVILVGDARMLSAFVATTRHHRQLAGTIDTNLGTDRLTELAPQLHELLERHLRSREAEALGLLERRTGERRAVSGIHAAWLAARAEHPEMLAVEEGFFLAARLSVDGDYLVPAEDVDHPDVVDDVVDELIETVLRRGGWIALVADGTLAEHDRVALTLRPR